MREEAKGKRKEERNEKKDKREKNFMVCFYKRKKRILN